MVPGLSRISSVFCRLTGSFLGVWLLRRRFVGPGAGAGVAGIGGDVDGGEGEEEWIKAYIDCGD